MYFLLFLEALLALAFHPEAESIGGSMRICKFSWRTNVLKCVPFDWDKKHHRKTVCLSEHISAWDLSTEYMMKEDTKQEKKVLQILHTFIYIYTHTYKTYWFVNSPLKICRQHISKVVCCSSYYLKCGIMHTCVLWRLIKKYYCLCHF